MSKLPLRLRGACVLLVLPSLLSAQKFRADKTYPEFPFGVTGATVTIDKGHVVTVRGVIPDSPAEGKLKEGDVLVALGGNPLDPKAKDPRRALGRALTTAEMLGRLEVQVRRGGDKKFLALDIPKLGAYAGTWPNNCSKSKRIVQSIAAWLIGRQQKNGSYQIGMRPDRDNVQGCLLGLFLLSTGEEKYLTNVKRQARALASKVADKPTKSIWAIGYQGILLGEYYLRTGDQDVLMGLKSLCDQAAKTQYAGAWGHRDSISVGYVQSGQMNSAGVPVLSVFLLARECGLKIDEKAYANALKFFYRMVGHGSVCYGDHRSELFANTNGRNAMLACALSLHGDVRMQRASEHLASIVADSYYAHEFGHTGGGFNVIWRGLGSVHVAKGQEHRYRRQMDQLKWYYDLCRTHHGGFHLPATPPDNERYAGRSWGTGAIGLTYTAAWQTLRITGAPRTKHSVRQDEPDWSWGAPRDDVFLGSKDAFGYHKEIESPERIHELLRGRNTDAASLELCVQQMHHHNPMIRTWGARVVGKRATKDPKAMAALLATASHKDPRVRRAAFDAVSGYDNWRRAGGPKHFRGLPTKAQVSKHLIRPIVKVLHDKQAAWWELDGALWALGRALPKDIRANRKVIDEFAQHEEWYLREAAFWALVGLGAEMTGEEFRKLADIYAAERHVFARASFDSGFRYILRGVKKRFDAATEKAVVQTLGKTLHSAPLIADYGRAAAHECAHRTMMILKHFDQRVFAHLVPDIATYLRTWSPNYQHSVWLITGSKWQPGFVKVAAQLGPDRSKPILKAFERCLSRENGFVGRRTKAHQACFAAMRAAVK